MGYRALDANGRKSSPPPPCEKALTKPDAPLTKEALGIAVDIDNGDTRMAAMDNLEMLVENIDNANALYPAAQLSVTLCAYALSGLLKHNVATVEDFTDANC